MTAAPAEPPAAPPVAPAEPPAAAVEPPTPPEPPANPWGDDFDAEKAWKLVQNLKQEVKDSKSSARASAADEARKELSASIAKILNPEAVDPTTDPAQLAEQITSAQADARRAQVALAVFQNAGTVGDPHALLDSSSFLASLKEIDHADPAAVQAAIAAAVEANPRLGAAPPAPGDPRVPQPNPAQGGSGSGAPGLDAQIAAAVAAKDTRLAIHLQNQKLATQRA